MTTRIDIPDAELAAFCRKHGIRTLELFGSVLRDDFNADSDVDVLVEFMPGRTPGLDFFVLGDELTAILGRRVDIFTRRQVERSGNWIFRRHALERTETVYDAA